jgi:hypothetical protein
MRLPFDWNRSRATALGATLALHVAVILWLLALRFDIPAKLAGDLEVLWQSLPAAAPIEAALPPVPMEAPPTQAVPVAPAPITALPLPAPFLNAPPDEEGWSNFAKDAARRLTAPYPYVEFGEFPEGPEERPKEPVGPSIWPTPLPRVGKTVVTPEGETIIWVSDNCYVSISSRSLTQADVHAGRKGVRMCNLPVGKKEVRSDLFDSIKRPLPPQEPGCNTEGIGLSCSR